MQFPKLAKRTKQSLMWGGGSTVATSLALLGASATFPAAIPFWLLCTLWGATGAGATAWSAGMLVGTAGPPGFVRAFRPARREEVPLIHNKLGNYTGGTLIGLEGRLAIFEKNADCFHILEDVSIDQMVRKTLGMAIVYPLSDEAWREMQAGNLLGSQLEPRHVAIPAAGASAYYLSFLWAEGQPEQNSLVLRTSTKLKEWISRRHVHIATRPTTEEAMADCRRMGFRALDGSKELKYNEICVVAYEGNKERPGLR